jgi:hypothetical protein
MKFDEIKRYSIHARRLMPVAGADFRRRNRALLKLLRYGT